MSTTTATPCTCGKPVKARATYCSTPCRRRAQNARARSKARVGVLSPTTPPTEPLGVSNPSSARQDTPSVASTEAATSLKAQSANKHREASSRHRIGDRVRIWVD